MNGTQPILLLQLEGPLQSWGTASKWDYRSTGIYPSKSGIIGLLACAAGIPRGDERMAEWSKQIHVAVRSDRMGSLMVDYHTILSENNILIKSDGKTRSETIVSRRQYLVDACFLVAITGPETLLQTMADALKHPIWPVFLGRKSCVPTRPVLLGIEDKYTGLIDVLEHYPFLGRDEDITKLETIGCLIESDGKQGYSVGDEILDASQRKFGVRYVQRKSVEVKNLVSQ